VSPRWRSEGSCGGGAPASEGRRGRAGEVQWGPGKVDVLPNWGGRGRRRKSRGGPKLDGANGRAAAVGRASRTGQPFIGNWEERRKARTS
jgi:hypothetical protein